MNWHRPCIVTKGNHTTQTLYPNRALEVRLNEAPTKFIFNGETRTAPPLLSNRRNDAYLACFAPTASTASTMGCVRTMGECARLQSTRATLKDHRVLLGVYLAGQSFVYCVRADTEWHERAASSDVTWTALHSAGQHVRHHSTLCGTAWHANKKARRKAGKSGGGGKRTSNPGSASTADRGTYVSRNRRLGVLLGVNLRRPGPCPCRRGVARASRVRCKRIILDAVGERGPQ